MRATLLFLILCVSCCELVAQSPQRIGYQAIIRNSSNGLVASSPIGIRISLLQGTATGTAVYVERHAVTSNENGLISIEIGGGTVQSGVFSTIPWSTGIYFIKTETDPTGGTNYTITGTSQLVSVPFALYADSSGNGMKPGTQAGQMLYWDGVKWTTLPKGSNGQTLKWCNDSLTWGDCIAKVNTLAVSDIFPESANVRIEIENDGGTYIAESGVCISTTANPQYPADAKSYNQNGFTGVFLVYAGSLQPLTTYYARAYAVNKAGVAYGNLLSFTTAAGPPPPTITSLTFDSIRNITTTSANVWATITNDGGDTYTQRGFVLDTLPDPTVDRYVNKTTQGVGLPSFTNALQNLNPDTRYYIKAYAQNGIGIGYSTESNFKTDTVYVPPPPPPPPPAPTTLTDTSGNVYPVVKIANKHWTAKNLEVTRYKNGDSIPHVQDPVAWANLTTGAWCYYENNTANGTTYGKLYNWYAMNDPRGIAPNGWHVPNDAEWTAMIDSLGGASVAGGSLKSTTGWDSPNTGATNSSSFNGSPGGYRLPSGAFVQKGRGAYWWSSTPSSMSPFLGIYLMLQFDSSNAGGPFQFEKEYGYSVRLIWDH